jgi:hypothetical protein
MKAKKLAVSITAVLGAWVFWASSAYATTWYVRDGGGTTSQCTGTTNAVYSGSGSAQPCAFNHPAWAIGTPGEAAKMVSGDTLYIVGDSDVNPGAQAQYIIGYGMPNTVNSQCSTSAAYQCIMSTVPAGTSSSALTHILGIGTHQPQLWGTEGVQWILNLTGGGNYDIENLEITQHSSCSGAVLTSGVNFSIYPAGCGGTSKYPYGPSAAAATWAGMGIEMEGTNITTANLWVHNLAYSSINFDGNVGNWNSTNDRFIAAGDSLTQSISGLMTFSGNNTMTNDVWAWGGCMEKYPLPDPGNVKDINNYINCADQGYQDAYGGYALGGGFMMQNGTNGACGNWAISYSQFLFNLKTNIDFLHCNGTGTVNVYRSRFEGSTGETFKASVAQANLEESQFIANAPVWESAPFQALKAPNDGSASWDFIICRGSANTIFTTVNGEQINYVNDDLVSNCTANIGVVDEFSFNGCTGIDVNAYNTKFISGYSYGNGKQTNLFLNGGSCATGAIPFNMYNSNAYNNNDTANCTAGHNNLCATDPKIVGESSATLATLFGPTSYYEGTNLGDQLYLQSSSPLIGKGATNVTFTNGSSNDYNNLAPNSPPDIGAIQYNSCIANSTGSTNGFCSINNQCCGGTCSSEGQCGTGNSNPQPVVSITSPVSGSSFSAGSNVTITASASENNGTITNISIYNGSTLLGSSSTSPYNYVMNNAGAGTYTLTARATDANGVSTTSNAVTVTVENASILPSLPVVTITSPVSGNSFTAGSNLTITTTASETNGTISNISLFNGSGILLGTSSTSPYNFVDNNLLAGTYTFFAVAKDATDISTTSSSITVTITSSSSPVVAITSPVNGSSIAGSNLNITAAASEAGGTIAQVQFYEGSVLLATDTTAPYSYTWNNVPAGDYIYLTAKATDTNGVSTTSSPVTATLTPVVPVVAITSPGNGNSVTAGSTITITASASETNGTIEDVYFYNGSTLLGSDSTSPYSYSWTNVPAGSYTLTAVAIDANGISTTSSSVAGTVTSVTPVVAITSPADGSSFTAGSNITITASASSGSSSMRQVEFYNGSTLLKTVTRSPYSYTWSNVAAGNYNLTAEAFTKKNVASMSAAVAVTVMASTVAPSITTQPSSVTVTAPATATFSVAATGTPAPAYQWMQSVNGGSFTNISGATSASYTTPATTVANSGTQYECVVTNASGGVTSNAASLTVNPTPVAPSITSQPVSVVVIAPATATFVVTVTGTPSPTYQWMHSVNGGAYSNISGATRYYYITPATVMANSGTQYECVVTNASGSATSNAASLTVEPTPAAPSITSQPSSVAVTAPATAMFSVVVTGTPAPTYQWLESVNGGSFTNISGATSASYTTPATTVANSGTQYECMVTNASGSMTSNAAGLTVNPTPVAPSITTQPASMTVTALAAATFSVTATGTPAPTYQWMQSVNGGSFTNINGAVSASYTTPATTVANSGAQYECVVTNASGSVTSNAASLTVNPTPVAPSITSQPASMTVTAPATATFSVTATGTPAPAYQWMQSVNGGAYSNISGAMSASYTTTATTVANSGTQFECVVTNSSGGVTSSVASLTVNPAPVAPIITSEPSNVTITAPAAATFSVTATGTPAPAYQWMQSVNGGSFANINGANSSSYTTPSTVVANNNNQFKCVITNTSGSVASNVVTMTVNPTPVEVSITTQPVNVTVTAPSAATFSVAASGTPAPTYQWMQSVNGGSFTNINGAVSVSYTTPATTVANSGAQYECVVTNASGSVTSNAASLTVNPTPVAPSITSQPAGVTVTAPATATFSVTATGTPAPTYQWMQSINGGSFTNINGAVSASYAIPATTVANSGTQYECVVTNASGSVTSNAASLTVNPVPAAPIITSEPSNVMIAAPATATFSVAATGTPAPTYQWLESVNGGSFTNINGAVGASYTTLATTVANSGTQYECVVSNASGSATSNVVTMTVNPTPVEASITSQPVSMTVTAPATATFSVAATGTPAPTYQWLESVNGGSFTNISGATSASYMTPATTVANSGTQYECVVINASGSVTSNAANLTVNPAPVAPIITSEPSNVTIAAPATATFSVAATGTPAPTYQWMQSINGGSFTNINGAVSVSYTTPATTVANSGTQYECIVTNASGSVTSNAANLTVNPTPVAPSITAQPASVTVTAPATATFSVAATGTPAPTYQWMQSVNGGSFANINGAVSGSYTTQATTVANSGTQYECIVTNASGSVTSNAANLTVNPAPVAPIITSEPSNVTVTAPATATFSVAATGTPVPTYQWMQSINGGSFTNINGAVSASYMTPATTVANSGTQYECIVTNASGIVTSNAANLTVNPTPVAPIITSDPSDVTVTAPATATFMVAATGTPAPTYQWMQGVNGGSFTNINGATSASYTIPVTTVANSGAQFECVVSNVSGSVTSNVANLTVNPTPVAPSITSQPASVTVTAPATATFSVTATGTPAPAYQWMQSVNGGSFTNINGAVSASYTIPATTVANSGTQFECMVSNASGSVMSNIVNLSVNPAPIIPPVVILTTDNTSYLSPANVVLTANATVSDGSSISQVEFFNGTTLIGTATSSPYTFTWTNVPAGVYVLTAVATGSTGGISIPSVASIIVTAPVTISLGGPRR